MVLGIRNHIKLLDEEKLNILKNKYLFDIEGNYILVKFNDLKRVTKHPITRPFHINAKGIRKVCFSMTAINIWKELFKENLISLFEVQQAVNKLIITYQKVTKENVVKILSGEDIKIKRI